MSCQAEEIQVQCENDFKRFNPNSRWYLDDQPESKRGESVKTAAESADELLNYHITVEDLIRVYSELGLVLPPEIAEEMLFDADISGDGGVAYDDLIRSDCFCLELQLQMIIILCFCPPTTLLDSMLLTVKHTLRLCVCAFVKQKVASKQSGQTKCTMP